MANRIIDAQVMPAGAVRNYEAHSWVCRGCQRQRFTIPAFVVIPVAQGRGELKPRRCCSKQCAEAYAVTLVVSGSTVGR